VAVAVAGALACHFGQDGLWTKAFTLTISIGAAVLALGVSARLLRIDEFTEATRRVLRRVLPGRAGTA
jgi:hypothetical protein